MAHYRTGTINVNNGSTAVTGSGTDWINNASAGECLLAPDGKLYEIASIQSSTSMTLAIGYQGASVGGAGQAYSIVPTQSFIRDLATQAAALVNGFGSLQSNAGAGKFGDGTASQPGVRFSSDEDTGMRRAGSNTLAVTAGGVDGLYVGQYFVSTPHPLVSGVAQTITDWNAVASTGWYMADGATGAPDGNWYMGYTVVHNELWMTQEVWAFTNNTATDHLRYRRQKNNGTLTSWARVYGTSEEITTFAASLKGATFFGNIVVGASAGAGEAKLEVGQGRSGDGICYIDFHSAVGADYNARISRGAGTNGNLNIENSGYGGIALLTNGAVVRQFIDPSTGATTFPNSSGVGYGTGSGGTAAQALSKGETITINKPSMLITTHNAALGAGASVGFQVNNSTVAISDQVVATFVGTLTSVNGNYSVRVAVSNGSFFVHLTNESGGTLAEAVPIKLDVIKGSQS